MATTTQKSGLTFKHKVGYAMGDLGGCMTFALMGAMVTRYYTNVLQVNTAVLATLLLVWNIWDAVNDPMMGALMDKMYAKHHNKNGKFRPWLLRAAPLLAITSIVFWTVPTLFDGYTMLVVLFFCKILYEAATPCSTSPWVRCFPPWPTPTASVPPCPLPAVLVP